ncbi:MAG: type II secretion system protein [Pseudomonadota bacterium]
MRRPPQSRALRRAPLRLDQAGITLIELLVALGIIAAVAGLGIQVLTDVERDTEARLARAEMRTVASALRRFRADTGYWPKQGIFGSDTGTQALHPANFSQLFTQPANGSGAILPFNQASGTGWNGPYLSELDAATVTVGAMNPDGTGDPGTGAVFEFRGIGDTYAEPSDGTFFLWRDGNDDPLTLGRPMLYIPAPDATVACTDACLIGLGPNGTYDLGGGDDHVVELGRLN